MVIMSAHRRHRRIHILLRRCCLRIRFVPVLRSCHYRDRQYRYYRKRIDR